MRRGFRYCRPIRQGTHRAFASPFRGVFAVFGLALLATGPLSHAQEHAGEVRIARLVERLGSQSYTDRVEADRELAGLRSLARPQLELAAKSTDAEISARARELLRKIAIDELWQPTCVTYESTGAPAGAAIEAIGRQTGNRILVGDRYGGFRDGPVELHAVKATFWQIVDDVCRQTANHVRPHYDTREPGLALVTGEPGAYPVAYSGPVRATITGALRTFSEEFDYKRLSSKVSHQFRINLEMLWEDRLRVTAYRGQPDFVEAVTDSGETLSAVAGSSDNWNVATSGARQVPMELRIEPPPMAVERLAVLKLHWPLLAIGDFASIDMSQLVAGAAVEQDGYEFVIESFTPQEGNKYTLTVAVASNRPLPDPAESLFQEARLELLNEGAIPLRLIEQTNTLEGRSVRSRIVFLGTAQDRPPKLLRITYPRLRSQRNLEIVFHDVPLPTARPQ